MHWRSSLYAVTQVRNKNSNIHGKEMELLLKDRICSQIRSLWEQILSFMSSHFENGRN